MAYAIPMALMGASTLLSAGGTILGSQAEAGQLKSEAAQLDVMAGNDRASSQRRSIEARRQVRLLKSTALARGAASGGASDPTVVNILANLTGEEEYRALTALYEGEEEARSKELQAKARRKEAKNVKTAGLISGGAKILEGGATMYERFGSG